jgi:hypothetical protein
MGAFFSKLNNDISYTNHRWQGRTKVLAFDFLLFSVVFFLFAIQRFV